MHTGWPDVADKESSMLFWKNIIFEKKKNNKQTGIHMFIILGQDAMIRTYEDRGPVCIHYLYTGT